MPTYNDYLTTINPVTLGHIIDPKRPVLPYWKQIPHSMGSVSHSHPRGQFIYSSKGVTRIITKTGIYLIPSSQAFWCPPDLEHELFFLGEVNIANLFIDPAWIKVFPQKQRVVNVTPLAHELILKAIKIGENYTPTSKEHRLMEVVIDELATLEYSPLILPWSKHLQLQSILSLIFKDPSNNNTLTQWATFIHTSPRTLARLFQKEVNMNFCEWRMQARLLYAIEKLHEGKSVTFIALELGYSTASAFIAAFHKILGKSPLEYISTLRA